MAKLRDIVPFIEQLAGQLANQIGEEYLEIEVFEQGSGIGYSQFNEILLLLGFDRISPFFFQYLSVGHWYEDDGTPIKSIIQLKEGIERFSKLALLSFGNLKYAFKTFASEPYILEEKIRNILPVDISEFESRNPPLIKIENISPDKTYYLGYIVEKEINKRLEADPNDPIALKDSEERRSYVDKGKRNQVAYLASDHLDVYIATSMRLRHEYLSISQVINQVFESEYLQRLNLRWFDPTQAYCNERIDKGLSEALMLKRAFCTLYLAQESETLGKDSELASTLAQGKPVIAYVPVGDREFVDRLLKNLSLYNDKTEKELILEQLQIYAPELAWKSAEVRGWLNNPEETDVLEIKDKLYSFVASFYDKKASILKNDHPLGIQVNLTSGVANGVLVARTIKECQDLIYNIVLNSLDFNVVRSEGKHPDENVYLKEKITDSIFRLKTSDQLLSNSFWNFYINEQ